MKLRTFGLVLFCSTLLMSGCAGNDELSTPLTREYESYTGTFKALGSIHVASTVTHLFETEEGDVLYAFSDRYNLDEYDQPMDAYGIVTTYEELDKPLYEVTRLTEPDETQTEEEEVSAVEYRNTELGVVTQIYSNWDVETNDMSGLVSFKLPTSQEETEEMTETPKQDTIDLMMFKNDLNTTAESTAEERSTEIKSYVIQNYSDLANITPDSITVGIDKVMGLKYKTSNGDIYVFLPRGHDLFELSYHSLSMDSDPLKNTNLFSGVLNDFRFITTNGDETDTSSLETSDDVTAPSTTQVEISKFATLESNFGFSMSYPAAWYYVGGSTGYSFNDQAIEDVTAQAILKLEFNTGASEGTVRTGNQISVTKKVDSRSYTLTGSSEYETVIRTMLDSIQTIKAE